MSAEATYADWIAVDWGTSHLRAWAMAGDGTVRAEARSDAGMGALPADGFEAALLQLVEPWLGSAPTPVIAAGMVGARQGWTEAGYRPVPCTPLAGPFASPEVRDKRLRVHVIPGLSQASPPEVMRGEETQIAGLLEVVPNFDGVVCLPGTHAKWAHISAGEVVSFQTAMTGELFSLLSEASVLRHTVGREGWDDSAFSQAVSDSLSHPERLATRLFGLRAEALLSDLPPETARARLSGLLIGAELAATRPYWLGQRVAIVGDASLAARYGEALEAQGVSAERFDARDMTLRGLAAARRCLQE